MGCAKCHWKICGNDKKCFLAHISTTCEAGEQALQRNEFLDEERVRAILEEAGRAAFEAKAAPAVRDQEVPPDRFDAFAGRATGSQNTAEDTKNFNEGLKRIDQQENKRQDEQRKLIRSRREEVEERQRARREQMDPETRGMVDDWASLADDNTLASTDAWKTWDKN